MQTHARRAPSTGSRSMGPRLAPGEYAALGSAKRSGVLRLSADARTPQLCNAYFKFCYATQRPYIAVDRHGLTVTVDVAPIGGLAKAPRAVALGESNATVALRELAGALAAAQAAHPGVQLVNAGTLAAQAAAQLPGPLEGSNKGRAPDTSPSAAFTAYAPSRDVALALARDMHARVVAAFGLPTPEDTRAARASAAASRAARRRVLLLRRLTKLAADPVAVKNLRVPAGAIAGFLAAQRAGAIQWTAPAEGGKAVATAPAAAPGS